MLLHLPPQGLARVPVALVVPVQQRWRRHLAPEHQFAPMQEPAAEELPSYLALHFDWRPVALVAIRLRCHPRRCRQARRREPAMDCFQERLPLVRVFLE